MMPLKRVKKAYQKNHSKNLTNQFQKFNKNKKLSTMINNERYTLNDANNLITKIDEKKDDKNNAIEEYNDLVNKANEIKK